MRKITILGATPAKKNNKRIIRNGNRTFLISSERHNEWETDALWQLKGQKPVLNYPVAVTMVFYIATKRGRDLDNLASSVLDVLQKAGVLINDDCWHCCPITLDCGGVDKNARVEIFLDED